MANMIQRAAASAPAQQQGQRAPTVNALLNSILDGEGMRKRFNDLLGKRAPQFISSIITVVNADPSLQRAMVESPMTVVQAALRAAMYDLPIDPGLGYAYLVAFKNKKKQADGSFTSATEAAFIMGYKGMEQLALRSGVYARVPDATDVREGELVRYDRLTGDAEFKWIDDEEQRDKLPVIGYAGYFRLLNGAEKTIYMTKKQIEAHERKNRKGQYMGKGWRDDWDAMAKKTVLRRLIGHYGIMSIDYQRNADPGAVAAAEAVAAGQWDDEAMVIDAAEVVEETGEVITSADTNTNED